MTATRSTPTVFTVGHSTLEIVAFVSLLKQYGIEAVADVRSSPYSQHNPQFNREALQASLKRAGIQYVFLGRELGARRSEPECYVDGQAQYDRIANLPAFKDGLQRLVEGASLMRVALLCAEKEPLDCHRCILVCRHLKTTIPDIRHILGDGSLENHEQTEGRLLKQFKLTTEDLLRSEADTLDAAYDQQGKRIAYKEETVLQP
jgi:uncharacterized protein (DUF488 family)